MVSISLLIVFARSFSATINLRQGWPIKKQVEQLTKENSFIRYRNAYLVADTNLLKVNLLLTLIILSHGVDSFWIRKYFKLNSNIIMVRQ